MTLRIYDSQTREKAPFVPLTPGRVRMYVCGITSYGPSHVGHARSAVAFDVVYRWLSRRFGTVVYVKNYTDVDDKVIRAAAEAGVDPAAWSDRFIAAYAVEMAALRCRPPTHAPRVTEHIPEIIRLIARLEAGGYAYRAGGDVDFEVARFSKYGALSGHTLRNLEAGARVEVDSKKRSPFDFALWKAEKPGEPAWDSPWGRGRPGWHIECSAMADRYLGETFDIHGGGKDLLFPHHENELAQSCAASGQPFLARFWMHNGFVNLMPERCPRCDADVSGGAERCLACGHAFTEDDLKMSKSRGNFYPIGEILSRYEGEALRLLLLGSHYRTPIQFSHALLDDAEKKLERQYELLLELGPPGPGVAPDPSRAARFSEAMDDDFNTAVALADLLEAFGESRAAKDPRPLRALIQDAGDVLGLWQEAPAAFLERMASKRRARRLLLPVKQIERLIAERAEARKNKDWKKSDAIRDQLEAQHVVLKDSPAGTTWEVE